jgi:type IV pilus assembly protein PilV
MEQPVFNGGYMKSCLRHNLDHFKYRISNIHNSSGFTMIEVLVAVVIITVGLLAVDGMQTSAVLGNRSSNNLTIATQLAEEMVDRIRANAIDSPQLYNAIDTNIACAGADPALGDCTQWQTRLQASGLPGARGQVTVTNNSPMAKTATITVTLTWGTGVAIRTIQFTTIMETWIT